MRVVHYLNQFFGQIGGEQAADAALTVRPGPVGPGMRLQQALGDLGEVVATVVCGDNRAASDLDAFAAEAVALAEEHDPEVLIAGPAFEAGRYGLACGALCARFTAETGRPAVTAMSEENPGVELYRRATYVLKTGAGPREMADILDRFAAFAARLVAHDHIGPAAEEGYYPRGKRFAARRDVPAADRAVAMLAARLGGEPFATELAIPPPERVSPAPGAGDLSRARVALVTTGGVVPKGNPDGLQRSNSRTWGRYPVAGGLDSDAYESIHSGYDASAANDDPNRVAPLDALMLLQQRGEIGEVDPWFYVTTGVGTPVDEARRMGKEIAVRLQEDGVDAVVLTAT